MGKLRVTGDSREGEHKGSVTRCHVSLRFSARTLSVTVSPWMLSIVLGFKLFSRKEPLHFSPAEYRGIAKH
jgi:hypothetical protein